MVTPSTALGRLLVILARRWAYLLFGAAILDLLSSSAQDFSDNSITSASLSVAACTAALPAVTRPSVLAVDTVFPVLLQALSNRAASAASVPKRPSRIAAGEVFAKSGAIFMSGSYFVCEIDHPPAIERRFYHFDIMPYSFFMQYVLNLHSSKNS